MFVSCPPLLADVPNNTFFCVPIRLLSALTTVRDQNGCVPNRSMFKWVSWRHPDRPFLVSTRFSPSGALNTFSANIAHTLREKNEFVMVCFTELNLQVFRKCGKQINTRFHKYWPFSLHKDYTLLVRSRRIGTQIR